MKKRSRLATFIKKQCSRIQTDKINFDFTHFCDVRNGYRAGLAERVPCRPPVLLVLGNDRQKLAFPERKVVRILSNLGTKKLKLGKML